MEKILNCDCGRESMTAIERGREYRSGWVGITMYESICSQCFDEVKEIR